MCLSNSRDGTTALHRAVEGNQSKVIPLLLSADPKVANIQDKNGRTALHLACHLNHKECVIALFVSHALIYACMRVLIHAHSLIVIIINRIIVVFL